MTQSRFQKSRYAIIAMTESPPKGFSTILNSLSSLYGIVRHDVSAIWRAGWRPLLGFIGCYVAWFTFIAAPARGLQVDADGANIFLAMVFVQVLARGAEKWAANRTQAAG